MSFSIVEQKPAAWNGRLGAFEASPFLTSTWIECFRSAKRVPLYLQLQQDGETIGLCAGLILEPPHPVLRRLYRTLYTYSGPILRRNDPGSVSAVIDGIIRYARDRGLSNLNFGFYDNPIMFRPTEIGFNANINTEYIIDLRGTWDDVQRRMRRHIRSKIKRAQRSDLSFMLGGSESDVESLIRLLESTRSIRRSRGYHDYRYYYIPYFQRGTITKLLASGLGRLFILSHQDRIVCAQLVVVHGARAYGLLCGTNQDGYRLGANAYIWFKAMSHLHGEGVQWFNSGGLPSDDSREGLAFFKSSLGARAQQCGGGHTAHLGGRFLNLFTVAYENLPGGALKHLLRNWITCRSGE